MMPGMPLETPLVQRARELARLAHADHVRKAGNIPYFTHLDAVARLLVEHGYEDEVQLAAAYLHDLVEDRPAFADRMSDEMPAEVVSTVLALTEKKHDLRGVGRDKALRFRDYVAGLRADDETARRALPISCADKIHNTRSLVDAEREGHGILLRLSTRPGEHEAQLATLRTVYEGRVNDALLATFDAATGELLRTIREWLPGRSVMLAAEAHLGQVDKAGAPYIHHPLRLMLRAETVEEQMTAVLHDVVEDSRWTLERLAREGFEEGVVRALDHLTKRDGEDYEAFIERVAEDRLATRVKLLDLRDNADLGRIPDPTEEDHARAAKYLRAIARLEDELERRALYIVLDEESRRALEARAALPIVRANHVTLAHRVHPDALDARWIPGGASVGDTVALRAVSDHLDERVQAVAVEVEGAEDPGVRPYDGGRLHVTVSRAEDARSRDSNALLERTPGRPLDLVLRGTVEWVD